MPSPKLPQTKYENKKDAKKSIKKSKRKGRNKQKQSSDDDSQSAGGEWRSTQEIRNPDYDVVDDLISASDGSSIYQNASGINRYFRPDQIFRIFVL